MKQQIQLLPGQKAFCLSNKKYPAIVGGLGSGKSAAGVYRLILKMLKEPIDTAYYMPAYQLIKLRAIPAFKDALTMLGVDFTVNWADMYLTITNRGRIYFKSYDKPEGIIAYEVADSIVDELDTLKKDKAALVWRKVTERNRQVKPSGDPNSIGCVTTPDQGRMGFVYDKWVVNATENHELIKASTRDNIFLPEDYITQITDNYDPVLASLYIDGEFVNLNSEKVYHFYDEHCHTDRVIHERDRLHVGVDFNVGGCCCVVCVSDNGIISVVDEFVAKDTHDIINRLRHYDQKLIVYPDAAGAYRATNAAQTDIAMMEDAGLFVDAHKRNPVIRDRVNCVNALLSKLTLKVNVERCPRVHEALTQQGYGTDGEPEKYKDHPSIDDWTDALGYFIARVQPVGRKIFKGIGY